MDNLIDGMANLMNIMSCSRGCTIGRLQEIITLFIIIIGTCGLQNV